MINAMIEVYRTAISGLAAAEARIANTANNIANIHSTGRLPAQPGGTTDAYAPTRIDTQTAPSGGVLIEKNLVKPAYYTASDPDSPKANADGLVAAPNVNLASELVDLKITAVLYAANAAVIKTQSENEKRLLDSIA